MLCLKHSQLKTAPDHLRMQPWNTHDALCAGLGKAGVNRLSLGAQARQTRLLRLIGRIHNWEEVIASVEIARKAGFDNINLDLMFGLPSQTISDVRETLEAAIRSPPRIWPVTV